MGTIQVNLREVPTHHLGVKTNFQEVVEPSSPAVEATDALNTVLLSLLSAPEYQSILPLKGKYANDPSWQEFPDFLDAYDRHINDLYKE